MEGLTQGGMSTGTFLGVARLFRGCGELRGVYNGSYGAPSGRLVELCAATLARTLCDDSLSLTEQLAVLRSIPNFYVAELIWQAIGLRKPSFRMFWLFFQWLEVGEGLSEGRYHVFVRPSPTAVMDTLRLLNGLDELKRQPFGVTLRWGCSELTDCEKFVQMRNLTSMTCIEPDKKIVLRAVTAWVTYLKSNDGAAWNNLRVLSLISLCDVRLFYDLLYYIPSLKMVAINNSVVDFENIPGFRQCLRYVPENERDTKFSEYHQTYGVENIEISVSFQQHDREVPEGGGPWVRQCSVYEVIEPLREHVPRPSSRILPNRKRPKLNKSQLMHLPDITKL